jgi:hypothetical protein
MIFTRYPIFLNVMTGKAEVGVAKRFTRLFGTNALTPAEQRSRAD